jgi:hypothetical protein
MVALTTKQLAQIRQGMARGRASVPWDKPTVDAAIQALEEWFESEKGNVSIIINNATGGPVFTVTQKKKLVALFISQQAKQDGA